MHRYVENKLVHLFTFDNNVYFCELWDAFTVLANNNNNNNTNTNDNVYGSVIVTQSLQE